MSEEVMEKAREEAEARRQRILDSANSRLENLEGRAEPSTSNSKMAAMRKRRFKKKAKESDTKPKDSAASEETTKPVEDSSPTAETSKPEEPPVQQIPEASTDKKKYLGVAKMRRRMVKERQHATGTTQEDLGTEIKIKKKASKKKLAALPIIMHGLVAVLLFLAGLDVGLQQKTIEQPLLIIHSEFAPRQLGGLQLLNEWVGGGGGSTKKQALDEQVPEWKSEYETDEFAEAADEKEHGENIDPLFRVDLDKLTQGDSLYLMAGRFAVRVHRLNLALFYYGPKSFFEGLADFLLSLGTFPPVFCIAAVVIRQIVGKGILGAKLPDKKQENSKDVITMVKNFVSNFILSSFPTAVTLYDIWTHVRADMYVVLCGFFVGIALVHSKDASSPYGTVQEEIPVTDQVPVGTTDEL